MPRTWPPASQPWATMMSAPTSAARTASATLPTLIIRRAPASWMRPASGAGSPQNSETMGTRSSSIASISSATSKASTTLATKGRSVAWRRLLIRARASSPPQPVRPSVPRPPASETAAASAGPAALPIAAWITGSRFRAVRRAPCASQSLRPRRRSLACARTRRSADLADDVVLGLLLARIGEDQLGRPVSEEVRRTWHDVTSVLPTFVNELEAVAVRIADLCRVISRVVVKLRTGIVPVRRPGGERRGMGGPNVPLADCNESDMDGTGRGSSLPQPEENAAVRAEALQVRMSRWTLRSIIVVAHSDAENRQHCFIEPSAKLTDSVGDLDGLSSLA